MTEYRKNILNPVLFKYFTLKELPLAFIAGLKVDTFNENNCIVSVKYNYLTKNPFHSMYFAAQAMAAEMSTGLLVMQEVQRVKPIKISMLVYRMECDFIKKATGRIFFESKDGAKVKHCMESIVKSKEGQILDLYATGKNEHGEIVSTYKFTWTLKQK